MKYLCRSRSIHMDEKTKSLEVSKEVFDMLWEQKPWFGSYEEHSPRKDKWTQVSHSNTNSQMGGYFLEIKRVKI